ncbi:unnamed protein product [Clonostachys byssicola]|uniref:Uncharacterized protein n=1 Tax=Clonostachys byssicola TaxID=160290 RepID=A0A9N9UQK2_9HYPO|nr:unnamed protein product [Clonostachys byssicola]
MSSDHPYESPPSPPSQTRPPRQHQRNSSDASSFISRPAADSRQSAFPYSFIRAHQANLSSTSLVPSTAEGKPIPVDDSTAQHRTSALRELNNNFPSRHRYAKSSGAQSSTYSEPVIVRSYHPPVANRPANNFPNPSVGIIPQRGGSTTSERSVLPFAALSSAGTGMLSRMVRARESKLAMDAPSEARLPPVDAFSFKNFISNIEPQEGRSDINADLDRIAEICAKSRYSLSNQYEVHYAPHGSGSSFLEGPGSGQDTHGPTLQVVSADDEQNMKRNRRRRHGARPSSRAMGTLETIISSSRSSDDEISKKKSAAELADQVRGRTVRRESQATTPTSSMHSDAIENRGQDDKGPKKEMQRKKSMSLALIDGTGQSSAPTDSSSPRNSSGALVSEPALPQASTSQLEIRTGPEVSAPGPDSQRDRQCLLSGQQSIGRPVAAKGAVSYLDQEPSLLTSFGNWIPWKSSDASSKASGRAEGSLRSILRNTDVKGKANENSF